MDKERQAVIVGVGRYTQDKNLVIEQCKTPQGMYAEAAKIAAHDTGVANPDQLLKDVVCLGAPGMFLEMRWRGIYGGKPFVNYTRSVANEIGANPEDEFCVRSEHGGNGPQYMMSTFSEMIANGTMPQGPVLVGGTEVNGSFDRATRSGKKDVLLDLGWGNNPNNNPKTGPKIINQHPKPEDKDPRENDVTLSQFHHIAGNSSGGMALYIYPLFENAYAHSLGRTADEHLPYICDLFSRFSVVAASQPQHSWYPTEKTKEFLMTPSKDNRIIGYPYRKWLCARDEIDMSSCAILMSWAEAERRGISEDKLVFIHGSGDGFDANSLALRHHLHKSDSMQVAYNEAFRSAGLGDVPDQSKIAVFDFYSCFPIAVEQACKCVGLHPNKDDVSRMTATGGLPYHGGPGSNYSGHGLCAIVEKLRTNSFRGKFGCVGANGGWLTEHSVGIYSTNPPAKTYSRRHYDDYQGDYQMPFDQIAYKPTGTGEILTWTVRYGRQGAETAVIVGQMVDGPDKGKRFIANSKPGDMALNNWLLAGDRIGDTVAISPGGEIPFGRRGNRKIDQIYAELNGGGNARL